MYAVVLLVAALLPSEIEVSPAPDVPDAIVRDRVWRPAPPRTPIPIWNPGAEPTPPPTERVPEPLYCRVEAPFPNTDECLTPPEPTDTPETEVTPGDVLEETKRIGLPRLKVTVQPPGATLVNLDTIFHTTTQPFERTVTILDSTVTLHATPTTYTWHHGDGTTQTTSGPGRPYPATDITHHYTKPGHTRTHVDVTYQVTYRIDNGPWQQLDTTITATGPTTPLRIRQAQPILTH